MIDKTDKPILKGTNDNRPNTDYMITKENTDKVPAKQLLTENPGKNILTEDE